MLFFLCSQRVLTAEFIKGCRVDEVDKLLQAGLDVADVSFFILCRQNPAG